VERADRRNRGRDVSSDDVEPSAQSMSLDERAAIRAFLQRSEVRLSTMHRVASALLSGAGLMVLLPAVERDAVIDVLRSLLTGDVEVTKLLLTLAVGLMLLLPFTALSMVLRDLIHFYFHSNHVQTATGDVFTPRFTLTGLQMPADELGESSSRDLAREREDPRTIELLVPANDRSRADIDQRIVAYGGLGAEVTDLDDRSRASALFVLAASRPRDLLNEVAKIEHGMARHVLRTQTIVLRYVKALLVLLTTAMATFSCAAVVDGKSTLLGGDQVWLAGILLVWAPMVILAVTSPVRWLDRLLRSEGAAETALVNDRELTRVELLAVRLALVAFAAAFAAIVVQVAHDDVSSATRGFAIAETIASTGLLLGVVHAWSHGHSIQRLAGRKR
jgi:hypothetical protein